ncbi:rhomboid family intramembrane serine protease [Rubrivirga sp. S365]|uniref:rhomboid family intramembrane serine protease n=1 Tax=Rubrivirga sp. S365 TaxID=3076080 RepID=UPI0028C79495|nr:rhomboid family intramembrane serine protease [Rubrivirga sp. S365]MDT7856842.1 rhomboid family intramembrane serine protease [Rubrivirga sp. S365]
MLFPISDDDRLLDGPAWATILLIVANVLVFGLQLADPAVTYGWSAVPEEITSGRDLANDRPIPGVDPAAEVRTPADIPQRPGPGPAPWIYLTVLSSMFMHGGYAHIAGNVLYLWIFGDNVEHRFGTGPFLLFYLASGVAATALQVALGPHGLVPTLGASGAISGVLGAYLVLFPTNRVYALFFFRVVSVPAVVVLGLWVAFQFVNGYGAIASAEQMGGVAYGAHVGGFVTGVVIALVLRARGLREQPNALARAEAVGRRR